jgi:transposase-like protein
MEEMSSAEAGLELDKLTKMGLEELARLGVKQLLETVLEEEVSAALGRARYQRLDEEQQGYRNGSRKRQVQFGSGLVELARPKVTGAKESFRSKVLPAWKRRSAEIEEAIPLLYAEGLSTRDFRRALGGLWGQTGLSRSSISRANKALYESFRAWRLRDLSGVELVYLFLDGVYLKMRVGGTEAEAVLVAHGVTAEGKREMVGLMLGGRESEASWKALLSNLEIRGLRPPALVVSDGNAGLIKALKNAWPEVPRQRCIAHRIRNILERVPRRHQGEVKRELVKIFYGANLEEALAATRAFVGKFGPRYPAACGVLAKDLADCLTFYCFPQEHWKRLRTSNVIERAFREVRRRTDVVGRFPNESSALVLLWATLEQDRLKWRGLRIPEEVRQRIAAGSEKAIKEKLDLKFLEEYLEAA